MSNAPDLQPYVVHEAWKAIRDTQHCTEKQPLTQVSCWCIGEYGAGLLNGVSVDGETITVSEQEVIGMFENRKIEDYKVKKIEMICKVVRR